MGSAERKTQGIFFFLDELRQKSRPHDGIGWCREREKDCQLVWTIFIFVVPRQFLASGQKIKF